VSGLAKGVDRAAHEGALAAGGKTVAVIGTPLSKAYPIENAHLQEQIYREHLLISPFAEGEAVYKSNFPARNRVMAALSDATAIIEASDTSGTLHQAAECTRLKRWLFISQAIVDDPTVTWPAKFLSYERAVVLTKVSDITERIKR
jgi:DNA processing protein